MNETVCNTPPVVGATGKAEVQDRVVTKHLEIVNDAGKSVATICPSGDGAGLWITGPEGHVVAIYSIQGQTCIGLYRDPNTAQAVDIGLCVGKDGPFIQVVSGDKIRQISAEALVALAK